MCRMLEQIGVAAYTQHTIPRAQRVIRQWCFRRGRDEHTHCSIYKILRPCKLNPHTLEGLHAHGYTYTLHDMPWPEQQSDRDYARVHSPYRSASILRNPSATEVCSSVMCSAGCSNSSRVKATSPLRSSDVSTRFEPTCLPYRIQDNTLENEKI